MFPLRRRSALRLVRDEGSDHLPSRDTGRQEHGDRPPENRLAVRERNQFAESMFRRPGSSRPLPPRRPNTRQNRCAGRPPTTRCGPGRWDRQKSRELVTEPSRSERVRSPDKGRSMPRPARRFEPSDSQVVFCAGGERQVGSARARYRDVSGRFQTRDGSLGVFRTAPRSSQWGTRAAYWIAVSGAFLVGLEAAPAVTITGRLSPCIRAPGTEILI